MLVNKSKVILLLIIALLISSCSDTNNPTKTEQQSFKIATWNIQIFGQSKLKDTSAMRIITQVCKQFDIVAIQEIRSAEQNVIPTLMDSLGNSWKFVISGRLGRTSSKEQYAFIYNSKVVLIDTLQTLDPLDQIHREPYLAKFRINNAEYSFLDIHTDPDEEETESYYLDTLARKYNAILCGDFNRHPMDFDNDYFFEDFNSAMNVNEFTNLADSHSYDNFLFIPPLTFKGSVYNFKDSLGLSQTESENVSDHYPVYITIR